MTNRVTLSGKDWDELLARHHHNIETLRAANEVALGDTRAGVERVLDEVSRLIDGCAQLQRKSNEFEEAMAALARAGDQLKAEADALPEGFLAAIAPALLSPFTSVCSFSEILADYPTLPLDQRNSFLDIAIRESRRLATVIDRVVDLARLRAGRADWRIAAVEIGAAVDEAVAATEPLFRDKVVRLDVALPARMPPVRADAARLAQVVENLLANAAKFSQAGRGRVALAAAADDRWVEVSVADDGPGVAPERQGIIFAQFLEREDTLQDEPRGSGLGLAVSKQVIEHMGGRIWVESAPGEGARFAFTVPRAGTLETRVAP